jgi:hypothetical protein
MISEPGMCCKVAGKRDRDLLSMEGKEPGPDWRPAPMNTKDFNGHLGELTEKPIELARHESYPFDRECKVNI